MSPSLSERVLFCFKMSYVMDYNALWSLYAGLNGLLRMYVSSSIIIIMSSCLTYIIIIIEVEIEIT